MSKIITYDPLHVDIPNIVLVYSQASDVADFSDEVNKVVDPIGLSALEGVVPQKYWKVTGSPLDTIAEMSQAEKDIVDIGTTSNIVAGTMAFEKNGKCKNKWLGFGASKSSDTTPYIVPCPMTITALTFINDVNSIETDIEIYKNGTKLFTWEVRNKRWGWKTQGLALMGFIPGDKLGMFLRDKGTDPKNVIVTLHYTADIYEVGEGGSSTL